MLIIKWTNLTEDEQFDSKKEVEDRVAKIGTDGSILKWLNCSENYGVIIYYNKIIGYVIYEKLRPSLDEIKKIHLEKALNTMTKDCLINVLKEYDDYVQKSIFMEDNEIDNLLTWISLNYK